jgi:hypothetical protein
MEQAFKINQRGIKCAAVQKIAEERVKIVGGGEKKIGQKTTPQSPEHTTEDLKNS